MSALNHGSSPSARYQALDYLRGVAALVVVAYHAFPVSHLHNLLPSGYLAVDFFFLLSGFVLAHGYEPKLLSGALTFRRFATLRLYRLMPLVIVGVLLGGGAATGEKPCCPG